MILTIGEGGFLAFILACIIAFWLYRKDQKANKKIDEKIAIIDNRIKEFDKLGEMLNKGQTIIKKSEFKYLTDKDFASYVGVKFI